MIYKHLLLPAVLMAAACSSPQPSKNTVEPSVAELEAAADNLEAAADNATAELEGATDAPAAEPSPAATSKAEVSAVPSFDTVAYCETIGDTAGGSYMIERTCREQENEARNDAYDMTIPARVARYCTSIGETAGGSYTIFKTCVEQEMGAAAEL